jgi:hypothetical protein
MNLKERIEAFSKLGLHLQYLIENENKGTGENSLKSLFEHISNEWFSTTNILFMFKNILENLSINTLNEWVKGYPALKNYSTTKTVGLVTAGNIPLVGFHDVLCVLISGHHLLIKHSSKDEKLMNWMLNQLIEIEPKFMDFIHAEADQLKNFDAIIATGSDNTARYFEYYFGKYPNIIRKNRNSIALLTGNETDEDLKLLADDMLMYFGLGCRNVSKLFVPENFDIQRIFKSVIHYNHLIDHNKYANNYAYNKSIYLMNGTIFLENGFFILTEDLGISSPISVVYYQRYSDIEKVKELINLDKERIQCIVAKNGTIEGSIGFGEAQKPALSDYADNIDTMGFLLSL